MLNESAFFLVVSIIIRKFATAFEKKPLIYMMDR